jgi:hypothetical protein
MLPIMLSSVLMSFGGTPDSSASSGICPCEIGVARKGPMAKRVEGLR